jgi:hypothetical protein
VIPPKDRDPRLITVRRGCTLTDENHHLLAVWAAACTDHVLPLFEAVRPEDPRPRQAIEHARAWARGEVAMMRTRAAGGHATGRRDDLCWNVFRSMAPAWEPGTPVTDARPVTADSTREHA